MYSAQIWGTALWTSSLSQFLSVLQTNFIFWDAALILCLYLNACLYGFKLHLCCFCNDSLNWYCLCIYPYCLIKASDCIHTGCLLWSRNVRINRDNLIIFQLSLTINIFHYASCLSWYIIVSTLCSCKLLYLPPYECFLLDH